ncbi:biopolymer transporter ExbD [Shewanella sp. KX20019]|uniref:biopolymer transporter ExbD n=1 Tax=Shewanella sp. KX20019 TaxID=2803864 RepID=UPI001926A429|nr:biopolymer transporter ExbD [Shewanella sp. KX20019]QQX78583.1 biopolymer transporter ExbD [Shewanella sp. KX20019]
MKINAEISSRPVIEPMLSLINVVFLLLVFFLVVGHIDTEQQIELQMLTTQSQHSELTEANDNWLYVTLTGECYYHEKRLRLEQFQAAFPSNKSLYVAVDASLTMGKLQHIVTELKQLDIADISLITRLDKSQIK